MFLRRYWYGEGVGEIAAALKCSEEKVKSALFRTRNKLREAMIKEEIYL
jgi:DNA-directed RNA polymerase specialized sigma24 family protein